MTGSHKAKAGTAGQTTSALHALGEGAALARCRMRKPISDEEALAIGKEFDAPSLFEHVARARKRVVGAMFPTDIA